MMSLDKRLYDCGQNVCTRIHSILPFRFTVAFNVAILNLYYMITRNNAYSYNIIQAIKILWNFGEHAKNLVNKFDVNNPIGTRKSIFVNCKWLNIRDLHFRNCFTEKNVFLDDTKNTSAWQQSTSAFRISVFFSTEHFANITFRW